MSWELFTGNGVPNRSDPEIEAWERIPPLPSWRRRRVGESPVFEMPTGLADAVNASLHLRRPLLLSGGPGSGKSTLVDLIAAELEIEPVLRWHITSKSTLVDGLFEYDALGRLHATQQGTDQAVENFVTLGPLGTALADEKVRAVLIDEIDKSDLDLPGDLLNVMENGEYKVPVLARANSEHAFTVRGSDEGMYEIGRDGMIRLRHFPVIVFTSNGERAFSAPFLRRCVRFTMPKADRTKLTKIITAHLSSDAAAAEQTVIGEFADRLRKSDRLAINQILEFVHLVTDECPPDSASRERLAEILLQELSGT